MQTSQSEQTASDRQTPSSKRTTLQTIRIVVPDEVREFFKDVHIQGHGGYQGLCKMLSERLQDSTILKLTQEEFRRVVRYASHYGEGGFQTRLRKIVVNWVDQNFEQAVK